MKYPNGQQVSLGDRVKLWKNQYGTVVCSIDTSEFTQDYPQNEWEYLKSGVIIKADTGEVFHYDDPDEDFEFVKSVAIP
jgi:hypothetical protein